MVIITTIVKYETTVYHRKQKGEVNGMIQYTPFWRTLKEKGISTYALINNYGISSSTIQNLREGKGITTMKINDLCRILHCRVEDIIEYVED